MMMDDLISRKEAIEAVKTLIQAGVPEEAIYAEMEEIPTAFSIELVINELKTRRDWHDINEQPKNPRDTWEVCDIRERKGKWLAYNEAIEIIRKAGLNERNIVPGKKEKQR